MLPVPSAEVDDARGDEAADAAADEQQRQQDEEHQLLPAGAPFLRKTFDVVERVVERGGVGCHVRHVPEVSARGLRSGPSARLVNRSEEHTSELKTLIRISY